MIILGIDPGTATIGIGLVEVDGERILPLHCGWIETSKEDAPEKRLAQIHLETEKIIEAHRPDIIAIERLFFFINYRTAMAVAESIGVIKLAAEHRGVSTVNLAPLEIKSWVAGNGKASKSDMKIAVKKLLGIKTPKGKKTHFDDLCDALAVAICCARKSFAPQSDDKAKYNKGVKKKSLPDKPRVKKGYRGITKRRKEVSEERG
jgi:crossover junction endodeoxyribonuclease RuvC